MRRPWEFLAAPKARIPSCLILDVRMPGLSGLDLQQELSRGGNPIPIIFITGHGDISMAVRAMKAGAMEFLSKPFRDEELLDAIRHALERDGAMVAEQVERDDVGARYATLTAREKEVIPFIVRGALNKQTAADLGVSEMTVKVHRHNIMRKMQARSLPDLLRMLAKLPG